MADETPESRPHIGRRQALLSVGALGAAGVGALLADTQLAAAATTPSDVLHLGDTNNAGKSATGLTSQSSTATLDLSNAGSGAALLVDSGFVQLSEVPTRGFVDAGSQVFDIRAFGPVTPDASATLTAALKAAGAKGGVVYLPPGHYQISQPITIPGGVTLRGASRPGTVLTAAQVALTSVLSIVDAGDVTIEDLSIDMTGATAATTTTGFGINILADTKDVLRTMIRNVSITNAPLYGLQASTSFVPPTGGLPPGGPTTATLKLELDLVDVTATQSVIRGISVTSASSLRLRGVRSNHNGKHGIVLNACMDVEIVGCETLFNGNHGISTSSGAGTARLALVGNNCSFNGTLKQGLGDGIVMSNSAVEFAVVGNVCVNNFGINLDCDITTQDSTQLVPAFGVVSGNVCNRSASLHGMSINHAVGVAITGNTMVGNKLDGLTVPNCQSLNVVGNVIGNNGSGGILVATGANPPSGLGGHVIGPNTYFGNGGFGDLSVVNGVPYTRVEGGQLVLGGGGQVKAAGDPGAGGGAPAPVPAPGSNGVRGSIGFGSGSTPQAGDQVTVTYPQPLPAPGFVQLTPGNNATAALLPYVSASTGTGFTVALGSAPPAGQSAGTFTVTYQVIG